MTAEQYCFRALAWRTRAKPLKGEGRGAKELLKSLQNALRAYNIFGREEGEHLESVEGGRNYDGVYAVAVEVWREGRRRRGRYETDILEELFRMLEICLNKSMAGAANVPVACVNMKIEGKKNFDKIFLFFLYFFYKYYGFICKSML